MTQSPPPPPDLAPAETAARWFAALPRAGAPAWDAPAVTGPAPRAGAWRGPLAAAAAVLLALALPTPGRDVGGESSFDPSPEAHLAVAVVDDPSVPMLHALETFDQLAMLTQPDGTGGR